VVLKKPTCGYDKRAVTENVLTQKELKNVRYLVLKIKYIGSVCTIYNEKWTLRATHPACCEASEKRSMRSCEQARKTLLKTCGSLISGSEPAEKTNNERDIASSCHNVHAWAL